MEKKRCLNCEKEIEKKRYVSYSRVKFCSIECNVDLRTKSRAEYLPFRKDYCEECNRPEGKFIHSFNKVLTIHHIDENPMNNKKENLKTLCRTCHLRMHRKKESINQSLTRV